LEKREGRDGELFGLKRHVDWEAERERMGKKKKEKGWLMGEWECKRAEKKGSVESGGKKTLFGNLMDGDKDGVSV
jgi:hypothetical protein